jgi:hypothetical protein
LFDEVIAELGGCAGEGTKLGGSVLFFIGLRTDIHVWLTPAEHPVYQGAELAGGDKHGDSGS